jgi:proteasome lid subunit RPN8/RPN11
MKITREIHDEMVAHALEAQPEECCGLVGTRDGVAVSLHRIPNSYSRPRYGFRMDGREYVVAVQEIEAAGCEVNPYHSHPRSAARPSQQDVNEAVPPTLGMPLWPGAVYIIVGFPAGDREAEVRGYLIDGDGVAEVALSVD